VVGHTSSSNFPIRPGAYDNTFGGMVDAFVTRFDLTTDSLEESTYLGGVNDDEAFAVGLYGDSTYVVGVTGSPSFPANAYDTSLGGASDAFVSLFEQSVSTAIEEREEADGSFEVYRDRVEVSLKEASYVGVDVYADNGRRAGSVSAGFLPRGQHSINLPELRPPFLSVLPAPVVGDIPVSRSPQLVRIFVVVGTGYDVYNYRLVLPDVFKTVPYEGRDLHQYRVVNSDVELVYLPTGGAVLPIVVKSLWACQAFTTPG